MTGFKTSGRFLSSSSPNWLVIRSRSYVSVALMIHRTPCVFPSLDARNASRRFRIAAMFFAFSGVRILVLMKLNCGVHPLLSFMSTVWVIRMTRRTLRSCSLIASLLSSYCGYWCMVLFRVWLLFL